jgi:hypothetical protein
MSFADHYRTLAADCDARARHERVPQRRAEWAVLAASYRRLAEQAERNSLTDIIYEPPFKLDDGNQEPDNGPAR